MITSPLTRPVELSEQPTVARRQLARLLDDASWGGDVDAVVLAVHEAMVNAQRHAGGVSRARAGFEGRSMVVEVCDKGRGFRIPRRPSLPDTAAERGRGLFLIRRLATEVDVAAGPDGEVCMQLRFEG